MFKMEIKPQPPVYTATPNIHTQRFTWAVIVALILLPSKSTQLASLCVIPASYFSYSSLQISQLKEQGEACSNTFTISRPLPRIFSTNPTANSSPRALGAFALPLSRPGNPGAPGRPGKPMIPSSPGGPGIPRSPGSPGAPIRERGKQGRKCHQNFC